MGLTIIAKTTLKRVRVDICIDNNSGSRIVWLSNHSQVIPYLDLAVGTNLVEFHISRLPLTPGNYYYTLFSSSDSEILDWVQQAGTFNVTEGNFFANGVLPPDGQGNFLLEHLVTHRQVGVL
jgi:lipopolysaccharide transport system ATP-binding protein